MRVSMSGGHQRELEEYRGAATGGQQRGCWISHDTRCFPVSSWKELRKLSGELPLPVSSAPAGSSVAVALPQQPIGGHLAFALHLDVSSQLQLEAVEFLQDVPGGGRHVDLQRCTNT